MLKFSLLSLLLAVAFAATAPSASANWISFQRIQAIQAETAAANMETPAAGQQVSDTKVIRSVVVHTRECACGQCCLGHIKTNYPAPGYENVFNRGYSRTTMGYKVLFGF